MQTQEIISNELIPKIFQLNLSMNLIGNYGVVLPMVYQRRAGIDTYKVILQLGINAKLKTYDKIGVELKGNVDVESLRYMGEGTIMPIPDEPGYYILKCHSLYKIENRAYKRVPYRREISVIAPNRCKAVLINISASGALIECEEEITGSGVMIEFILLKKNVVLGGKIIKQEYVERSRKYLIRIHFEAIDEKNKKIIIQTVRTIILMAKRRLQG